MNKFKKYRINENGICENPDTYGTRTSFIKVALFPDNKWRFGATWDSFGANFAGGCFGCGFGYKIKKDYYAYDSERDCIVAGLKYIESMITRYKNEGRGDCVDMSNCVKIIRKIVQPKQLSLFGV